MTDRPTTDPHDDLPAPEPAFEVASALHDGEGADVERADLDDDAVEAHRRAIAAVAGRVAAVGRPADGAVDDHVAAALAAFDDAPGGAAADGSGASGPPVTSLADRRPWWRRAPLGAVAAAVAVVALVGAIGFAAVSDTGGGDDTATADLESAEGADGADDAEAFDAAGSGGAAASGLSADEREAFASYEELAAALDGQLSARTTAEATDEQSAQPESGDAAPVPPDDAVSGDAPSSGTTGGAAGCDAIGAAGIDPATVELVRNVVVDDQLVTAVVHATEDGRQLTSIDEATCTVTDERPL